MRADELRPLPIFDGLTDGQLAELAEGGAEVPIEPGVDLFREGEHADFWWVLVDGAIDLVRHVGREDTVVARMDVPGRWAGGFRAWDEHGVYLATGRGATAGRVLRVPAEVLRERSNAWFPFGGHLIQGLYHTARSIESTARQRESLVTLGTLAAGLAHEINNPASAATRAVDALEAACATLLSSLGRLADDELSAAQFAALDALRREIEPGAADPDPLARADREQALSSWLARHGVVGRVGHRPAAGRRRRRSRLVRAGRGRAGGAGPRAGPGVGGEHRLGRHPAGRGEGVDPAHLRAGRRGPVLLADGPRLAAADRRDRRPREHAGDARAQARDGVTVVREYGAGVPRIEAYAGELNQVWTNLIDNAVDAMDGSGTLRLATRADGDSVVVEIGDTGPGMPPEVAGRAFEAFYTTKDVGKGTGLGLDIARRIVVERHGGTIAIDSRPGETVLRVALPVRPHSPTA